MSSRLHVIDSGAVARKVARLFVVDAGGVSREIKRLFVIDSGGVARQVYQNAIYGVSTAPVIDVSPGFSDAEIQYTSAGQINEITTGFGSVGRGDWVTPTSLAPGAHTIRAHLVSGTAPGGPALDTDHALSSTRTWGLATAAGTLSCTLTITIKDGVGNVMASGNIDLSVTA